MQLFEIWFSSSHIQKNIDEGKKIKSRTTLPGFNYAVKWKKFKFYIVSNQSNPQIHKFYFYKLGGKMRKKKILLILFINWNEISTSSKYNWELEL